MALCLKLFWVVRVAQAHARHKPPCVAKITRVEIISLHKSALQNLADVQYVHRMQRTCRFGEMTLA